MRNESEQTLEHILTSGCLHGNCPTIYRTKQGTFVVQGYAVAARQFGVELPDGELMVEIPPELLVNVVRILDGRPRILDKASSTP